MLTIYSHILVQLGVTCLGSRSEEVNDCNWAADVLINDVIFILNFVINFIVLHRNL